MSGVAHPLPMFRWNGWSRRVPEPVPQDDGVTLVDEHVLLIRRRTPRPLA